MDFQSLLQPMLPEIFFPDYWEKSLCFVKRQDPEYYTSLCSIAELDSLISLTSDASSPYQVRLVKTNEGKLSTRAVPYTLEKVINIYQVYRSCFEESYTLSIDRLDLKSKPIAELCRQLEGALHHSVAANLYFTPPDAQGFVPHVDTHDVFILQVQGSKVWRVYDSPSRLPLIEKKSPLPSGTPRSPKQTIELNAGDLLYLPRGFVHDTFTLGKPSLHLTVGIHVFRWADLISEALASVAEEDVNFREALPPGFLGDDCPTDNLVNKLRELLQQLAVKANCDDAVRRLEDRILTNGQPIPDGHFLAMGKEIDLNSVVQRRIGMMCKVRLHDDQVTIHFPGNIISGPKVIEPALQFIKNSERFKVSELPDCLEQHDKIILTRRLVREGLLSVGKRSDDDEE
jgi:ribosomal protein L16 Arg81 hydroxylase